MLDKSKLLKTDVHCYVGEWEHRLSRWGLLRNCSDMLRQIHPRRFSERLKEILRGPSRDPMWTNDPHVVDLFPPENVYMFAQAFEGATDGQVTYLRCLTQHPLYAQWKDEKTAGEMWSMWGEEWVCDVPLGDWSEEVEPVAAKSTVREVNPTGGAPGYSAEITTTSPKGDKETTTVPVKAAVFTPPEKPKPVTIPFTLRKSGTNRDEAAGELYKLFLVVMLANPRLFAENDWKTPSFCQRGNLWVATTTFELASPT